MKKSLDKTKIKKVVKNVAVITLLIAAAFLIGYVIFTWSVIS